MCTKLILCESKMTMMWVGVATSVLDQCVQLCTWVASWREGKGDDPSPYYIIYEGPSKEF